MASAHMVDHNEIDFQLRQGTLLQVRQLSQREPMIVCHCRCVCDRVIRAAIRAGASSEDAVSDACGAGSGCGGCIPALTELIEEELGSDHRHLSVITSAA